MLTICASHNLRKPGIASTWRMETGGRTGGFDAILGLARSGACFSTLTFIKSPLGPRKLAYREKSHPHWLGNARANAQFSRGSVHDANDEFLNIASEILAHPLCYGTGRVGGDLRGAPPLVEPDVQISRIRLSRRCRLRHAQSASGIVD